MVSVARGLLLTSEGILENDTLAVYKSYIARFVITTACQRDDVGVGVVEANFEGIDI
jgi:hypothetical protein